MLATTGLAAGFVFPIGLTQAAHAAAGAPQRPNTGKMTPRLAALAEPPATSTPSLAQEGGAGPDNTPGELQRLPNGRLVVDLLVQDETPETQDSLRAAGAEILAVEDPATAIVDPTHATRNLFTITVAVADTDLSSVADVPVVRSLQEVLTPFHGIGAVTSEGDTVLRATNARSNLGVDGTGVTVGTLSDSYDRNPAGAATTAAQDVASCDLPGVTNTCGHTTAVNNLNDTVAGKDEGRAMLQTVADLAPGSNLAFATAFISETSFANNITALRAAGASVIVDDVIYLSEPMYQDGPIAVAVNNARAAGVTYMSMAFNNNLVVGGNDVGSYEAQAYRPTPCPTLPFAYLDCHNFQPTGGTDNTYGVTVNNNFRLVLDLQWAQPRGGVTADYDIFVLDAGTGTVLASSFADNIGVTQRAVEVVGWTNATGAAKAVNVVVARKAGPAVRMKFVHFQNGAPAIAAVEYSASAGTDVIGPTIFGHNGAASAFTVGAVRYNNTSVPEPYTSHGPVTYLFQPVPSTTALGAPQVLTKPDFSAVDCVVNTFFPPGNPAPHRFCGTSDAAPHAAAVAALLLQAKPSASPAQVGAALAATAIPVGSAPPNVVGAGLIQADAAVLKITQPTTAPPCSTTLTGDVTGPVTIGAGTTTCITNARVVGPVTVNAGGALLTSGSQIRGGIVASGAAYVRLCGTRFSSAPSGAAVQVSGSSGPVIVGDAAASCPANLIAGGATLTSNGSGVTLGNNTITGNVTVSTNTGGLNIIKGNTIQSGSLGCSGNNPAPGNAGQTNTASGGKTGQCAAI